MTKEEIREGVATRIRLGSRAPTWSSHSIADTVLTYLDSVGYRLVVEQELPQNPYSEYDNYTLVVRNRHRG